MCHPIVQVFGLPGSLSEEALVYLVKLIQDMAKGIDSLGIQNEDDMFVPLSSDLARYGLGKELWVWVNGLPDSVDFKPDRQMFVDGACDCLQAFAKTYLRDCVVFVVQSAQGDVAMRKFEISTIDPDRCPHCHGAQVVGGEQCPTCEGSGRAPFSDSR